MAKVSGGVVLGRALKSMGLDTVFWLLGGPMQPVIWELHRLGIRIIDARHEQAAAMMAHAYSRVSGKVGVCITASGPASVNAATGVAVAFDDCAPLVAISGSASVESRGTGSFEEMDQVQLMKPITKQAWQIPKIEVIPRFVDMAFRQATTGRPGPIYLDLPADILWDEVDEAAVKQLPGSPRTVIGRAQGDEGSVTEALQILKSSERPIIIAGSGVVWSGGGPELQEFVECTRIPFFTTPLARGLIPEDHPLCFLGARSYAWKNADAALVVGTRANWIVQHLCPPRFAVDLKLIMVNIDPAEIGHNRAADVGIVGDAKAVLGQLVERARGRFKGRPSLDAWLGKLREVDVEREQKILPLLNSDAKPIHPLRICKEVRELLPRDGIVVADGNDILSFARQSIRSYYPRHRLNPGVSGCMGVAVPFGIGAKVAKPDKQVVVLSGDGSFGFNGMEIDSAVRNGINVVVIVSNNGGWSGKSNPPRWPCGRDLGFTRYDKMAEALGAWAERVEEPKNIRPALERAFAAGKAAVIDIITAPVSADTQPFSSNRAPAI